MKLHLLFIVILYASWSSQLNAQDIQFSFANSEITTLGMDTLYEVDVMATSFTPTNSFQLSSGQLYIDYDEELFGENMIAQGNVDIFYQNYRYLLEAKDNYSNTDFVYSPPSLLDGLPGQFSISWEQLIASSCMNVFIPISPVPLFRLKLKFLPGKVRTTDLICFSQDPAFTGNLSTPCGPYGACNSVQAADCINFPSALSINDSYTCTTENACALLTVPASSAFSTTPCTTSDYEWSHMKDQNGEVVLSIRQNGNELGVVTAATFIKPQPVLYQGHAYLGRHYLIDSQFPPNKPIQLRLYAKSTELVALKNIAANTNSPLDDFININDLGVTQYSGPTEDGVINFSDATQVSLLPQDLNGAAFNAHYVEITTDRLSEFWINSSLLWLPVELGNFSARAEGKKVLLDWTTESEVNSSHYIIERSANGVDFSEIGVLAAIGESTRTTQYDFIDTKPLPGENYYRLKMVDTNGSFTYSKFISIHMEPFGILSVYPNPLKGEHLEVSLVAPIASTVFLYVYDHLGRLVLQESGTSLDKIHFMTLTMENLPTGAYFLHLTDGHFYAYKRFIKLEE